MKETFNILASPSFTQFLILWVTIHYSVKVMKWVLKIISIMRNGYPPAHADALGNVFDDDQTMKIKIKGTKMQVDKFSSKLIGWLKSEFGIQPKANQ